MRKLIISLYVRRPWILEGEEMADDLSKETGGCYDFIVLVFHHTLRNIPSASEIPSVHHAYYIDSGIYQNRTGCIWR